MVRHTREKMLPVTLLFLAIHGIFGSPLGHDVRTLGDNAKKVKLSVSPSVITTDTWVTVSWDGVPEKELFEPNTNEYICEQDSFCQDVQNLSVWVGVFAKGSDRTPIGPQASDCANPPWLATSPIKWKPIRTEAGATQFHMVG
eukprot:m.25211 g.25211  ORF g.25211 m.25211 type:complete len:143 (-) comp13144_c0_seq1:436-864(-)